MAMLERVSFGHRFFRLPDIVAVLRSHESSLASNAEGGEVKCLLRFDLAGTLPVKHCLIVLPNPSAQYG